MISAGCRALAAISLRRDYMGHAIAPIAGRACDRRRLPFPRHGRHPISATDSRKSIRQTAEVSPAMLAAAERPDQVDNMLDRPTIPSPSRPRSPTDDQALLDAYSRAVIDVVDRVGPGRGAARRAARKDSRAGGGSGSGVIVAPDGLVLTNSHVVGGAAPRRRRPPSTAAASTARVVGDDPDTDLALVRVDAPVTLPAARARQFQAAQARPARDRDRQSARLRVDGDGRRGLGARPLAARAHRAG